MIYLELKHLKLIFRVKSNLMAPAKIIFKYWRNSKIEHYKYKMSGFQTWKWLMDKTKSSNLNSVDCKKSTTVLSQVQNTSSLSRLSTTSNFAYKDWSKDTQPLFWFYCHLSKFSMAMQRHGQWCSFRLFIWTYWNAFSLTQRPNGKKPGG